MLNMKNLLLLLISFAAVFSSSAQTNPTVNWVGNNNLVQNHRGGILMDSIAAIPIRSRAPLYLGSGTNPQPLRMAGRIQVNSTSLLPEYHNGTNWVSFLVGEFSIARIPNLQASLNSKMDLNYQIPFSQISGLTFSVIPGLPTSYPAAPHIHTSQDISDFESKLATKQNVGNYLTVENDPIWRAESVNYRTKVQNDALYQPIGNYLTSFNELDPTIRPEIKAITAADIARWNTPPAPFPVTAVNNKTGNVSVTAADVGLGLANNTSDADKPISTATQSALNGKENSIPLGTTAQYYRGDKTWQTLPSGQRVFSSLVTVGQSRAQLNASYPTANVGDMVSCPRITLGGAIYFKSSTTGGGEWQIISAPPVL